MKKLITVTYIDTNDFPKMERVHSTTEEQALSKVQGLRRGRDFKVTSSKYSAVQ